jgi:uncharacterized phiE125 gp8 family phage protein
MRLRRTQAPDEAILSAADARADTIRIVDDSQDDTIDALIAAATEAFDGKDGALGRALVTQSWELLLDRFPCACEFAIPLPPLRSVESITYVDTNGDTQTLATSVYAVDTTSEPGVVSLKYGQVWPTTRCQRNAVTIAFTAGYGTGDDVPERVKSAIKLKVADLFYQTQDNAAAVEALVFPFRVFQ